MLAGHLLIRKDEVVARATPDPQRRRTERNHLTGPISVQDLKDVVGHEQGPPATGGHLGERGSTPNAAPRTLATSSHEHRPVPPTDGAPVGVHPGQSDLVRPRRPKVSGSDTLSNEPVLSRGQEQPAARKLRPPTTLSNTHLGPPLPRLPAAPTGPPRTSRPGCPPPRHGSPKTPGRPGGAVRRQRQ